MAYLILFATAFIAATLFPAQSEAVLLSLLYQKQYSPLLLIAVASTGNILGSCINWYLGLHLQRFQQHRWFPFSAQSLAKAQHFYQRYGVYSLLLSWLPIIGDPITLIAGVLKTPFWRFVIIVSMAKIGRYVFIYLIYLGLW
ncbi:MAG: YqaA family protein [Acinetobacter sp.]|nr:YqaA family protein [Acinetobacter sp.]